MAPQPMQRRPETAVPTPGYMPAGIAPSAAARGPVGAGLPPGLSMGGSPGQQPDAPLTLTQAQAKWAPRWFIRGAGLSADSAVPAWMNAGTAGNAGVPGHPSRRPAYF